MRLRHNLVQTTLAAGIDDNDVSITLAGALQEGGVDIPTIAAPDYLPVTLGGVEIVWITAYTTGTTTATIEREPAGEDTDAVSHSAGAAVQHNPTKLDHYRYAPSALTGWFQDNAAASQAAVALGRGNARTEAPMPAAGSIVGVVVHSNAARTAGQLDVQPTIEGATIGMTATLDGTNTTDDTATDDPGVHTFDAGETIGAAVTTDGSWAPTTADIDVSLLVVFDLA